MLTLIHMNPVAIAGGVLRLDRKFHTGMLNYVAQIDSPIVSVHPLAKGELTVIDQVELPMSDLPYRVVTIELDHRHELTPDSISRIEELLRASTLVVGYGYGIPLLARKLGVRYIACLEYDLQTQLTVTRSFARNPVQGLWSILKCAATYYLDMVPTMRHALEVHCNGYPIFKACARFNSNRLLYLDSRMSEEMVIPRERLEERLASRASRPLRLIFSGRYEKMKGSLDAVLAAVACRNLGMNVEMDCYGSGSLAEEMRSAASAHDRWIRVHGPIAFPELVEKSHAADIFVCCHIQSDPSCTYLEAMGSGLPIVGYSNRMWSAMAAESGAGAVTGENTPAAVCRLIDALVREPAGLDAASRNARNFASEHCFEKEFLKRTKAINAALANCRGATDSLSSPVRG